MASCNDGLTLYSDEQRSNPKAEFSEAELEAARSLSPLLNPVGLISQSGAEQALLCVLAVETIAREMEKTGLLQDNQAAALDQVGKLFETRAQAAFVQQGFDEKQIDAAREEFLRNAPKKDKLVRELIVCLREIQDEV